MLRLPRRVTRPSRTRQQQNKRPECLTLAKYGPHLVLQKNTKLTWVQFEALRIKLARALSARSRLSRKGYFKHIKGRKKEKKKKTPRQPILGPRRFKQVWFGGFPHLAYRVKGRGSRMGKGKGNISCWYYKGRAGHTILRFKVRNDRTLYQALHKLRQLIPSLAWGWRSRYSKWVAKMKFWTKQLYGYRVTTKTLWRLPGTLIQPAKKYWLWRLAYTGMACDEAYSRLIEHVSRHILIIPAICLFDKHLSKFMNAQIITQVITALNNKIYRENLSTLDILRIFVSVSIAAIMIIQISFLI